MRCPKAGMEEDFAMSRKCELTAKGPQTGHKVSHSNIKTKAGAWLVAAPENAAAQGRVDANYEATLSGIAVGKPVFVKKEVKKAS